MMPLLFHLTTPPWDGVLSDGGADACDARADAVLRAASCAAAAAIVARLDCQTVVDLSPAYLAKRFSSRRLGASALSIDPLG